MHRQITRSEGSIEIVWELTMEHCLLDKPAERGGLCAPIVAYGFLSTPARCSSASSLLSVTPAEGMTVRGARHAASAVGTIVGKGLGCGLMVGAGLGSSVGVDVGSSVG